MALPPTLTGIELFSGVGMLGEGLRAGLEHLGIAYLTACHVEREAHAASVLVARMEEGSMDAAPVWSDVTTFDGRAFRGRVDCVVAGFPCQDLSVAGKRAGLDGHRSGLFFEVLRIADDCGAQLVFLENVAGIASATATVVDEAEGQLDERAAARVLGELADRGWNAEWLTLSAADVGASHGRARWFCVAWRHMADAVCSERRASGLCRVGRQQGNDGERRQANCGPRIADETLGDTSCDGWRERRPEPTRRTRRSDSGGAGLPVANAQCQCGERRGEPGDVACARGKTQGEAHKREWGRIAAHCSCRTVADANRTRSQRGGDGCNPTGRQEPYGHAGLASGILFAPGPNDPRWADIIASTPWLAPALSIEEQHDAAAAFAAAQPPLRGMADGLAAELDFDHRAQRLKCCGNGVVALCAATAAVVLLQRAGLA